MTPPRRSRALNRGRDAVRRARAHVLRLRVRSSALPTGLVLVYHLLDDQPGNREECLVAPHGTDLFAAHLDVLRRHYRVVPASAFSVAVAARRRFERPPVAITFDDDSPSHATRAVPALAAAGLTATFFLTGATLGQPVHNWWEVLEAFWLQADEATRHALAARAGATPAGAEATALEQVVRALQRLQPEQRDAIVQEIGTQVSEPPTQYLLAGEIGGLVDAGHEVAFHTRRHHPLTTLDPRHLDLALTEGRRELAVAAGAPLTTIAYPHGLADPVVAAAACEHGFVAGFTTLARRHVAGEDPMVIGRYWPTYGPPAHFEIEVAQLLFGRWGAERAA